MNKAELKMIERHFKDKYYCYRFLSDDKDVEARQIEIVSLRDFIVKLLSTWKKEAVGDAIVRQWEADIDGSNLMGNSDNEVDNALSTEESGKVILNEEQKKAFEVMMDGNNVFLTGNAGTGKSFLLQAYINYCQEKNKNVVVTAPTGIAALNLGGSTIHREFQLPLDPIGPDAYVKVSKAVKSADVIIIDEISMVRFDVFSYIAKAFIKAEEKTESKKQLIVAGDFFQLPPVMTQDQRDVLERLWHMDLEDGFAFEAPEWEQMSFTNIKLTHIIRQTEQTFIDSLNGVRLGNRADLECICERSAARPVSDAIYICSTNKEAQTINEKNLAKLRTKIKLFVANIEGKVAATDKAADDTVKLKVGARVMFLINSNLGYFKNGSMGYVSQFTDEGVVVDVDNGEAVLVKPHTWEIIKYDVEKGKLIKNIVGKFTQIPLKLAYAITIHKSQGQTFDKVNLNPACFCTGQMYVALSRASSCKTLYIKDHYINPKWLITSSKVIEFYKTID